jgi:hypothetical protein
MLRDRDIIKMNIKELKRLQVINKVLERQIMQVEAAEVLNLGNRQVRRIVKRIKEEGETGIIHKSRGRPSNRAYSANYKENVLKLYKDNYKGFGPLLASEKLEEINSIKVSDETLRLWLLEAGHWEKSRKLRGHHKWRERKKHFGEMVLLDGSHHDWLEGRGEELVLMGYIDDATGKIFGEFYDYEGTLPVMDSSKKYIKKHGIPMKIYLDKHTTYRSNKKLTIEEELKGVKALSQFERASEELGIEVIHANSPQAKGRIERLFGTLQDRLIKEMRLAHISNKEQANRFLKSYIRKHNKKFSVKPVKEEDFHMSIPKHINLEQILCIKKERRLRSDNTISFEGSLYLIEDKLTTKTVTVEQRTDSSLHLSSNGKYLSYKQVKPQPKANMVEPIIQKLRKPYIPPANHPWRSFELKKKHNKQEEVPCLTK